MLHIPMKERSSVELLKFLAIHRKKNEGKILRMLVGKLCIGFKKLQALESRD